MNASVHSISFLDLIWAFVPVFIVFAIFLHWSLGTGTLIHGFARMFIQLILLGYALTYIFNANQPAFIIGVLCVMLFAAGLIALRPVREER